MASSQHDRLIDRLTEAGVAIAELPAADQLTLDAVYTHDPALLTEWGMIILRPGKVNRQPEAACHRALYQRLGVPVLAEIEAPGSVEAGDLVWLDSRTLLVGRSFRTNVDGFRQLERKLDPKGVRVISTPLPHASGPSVCLHLMSIMSLLDESSVLVDLPWLAVETVELLRARQLRLIEIESSERATLACNVLALGQNRLLAFEENRRTNRRLEDAGFAVSLFPGSELGINGGGGPTCLTRPIERR